MRHRLYLCHTDRTTVPPLDITIVEMSIDNSSAVEAAGHAYAKWLLLNASGTYIKGMRKALKEQTLMKE